MDMTLYQLVNVVTIIATMATPIILIITACIIKCQLKENRKQLKANHDWKRRHAALRAIKDNRANYRKSIKYLNEALEYRKQKHAYAVDQINKRTESNKELFDHIVTILDLLEYLSVGINQKIFDEEVIKKYHKRSFMNGYMRFENYIKFLRKEHVDKDIYIQLENIYKKWDKREKEPNRESTDET